MLKNSDITDLTDNPWRLRNWWKLLGTCLRAAYMPFMLASRALDFGRLMRWQALTIWHTLEWREIFLDLSDPPKGNRQGS